MPGNLTLTIKLSPKTIAGCVDMLTLFIGPSDGDPIEVIVENSLNILITSLIDDKIIDTYETEEDAEKEIASYFEHLKETISKAGSELKEIESFMEKQENSESNPQMFSPEEESSSKGEDEQTLINPDLTFKDLPPNDPLVKKVEGDERMQGILVTLYSQIPRSFWGTDKAREFLKLSLAEDK